MKVNNELNALSTLANAVELGVAVIHEVIGDELGSQIVTDQGRDGIAGLILSNIKNHHTKTTGV